MENPTSGLVPLGKIGMWIMLLEDGWSTKLIFARFTSMKDCFLGNMELDNEDNIDTSVLILNENDDGGLAGLGRGYPCLPPGKLM